MVIHSRDTLDRDVLKQIGVIVSEWSLCEAHLSVAIWDLLELDWESGHIVTDDLSSLNRIHLFEALLRSKYQGEQSSIFRMGSNLVGELKELNSERNKVVHHVWSSGGSDIYHAARYTARNGKFSVTKTQSNSRDFATLAVRIEALVDEIDSFIKNQLRPDNS